MRTAIALAIVVNLKAELSSDGLKWQRDSQSITHIMFVNKPIYELASKAVNNNNS